MRFFVLFFAFLFCAFSFSQEKTDNETTLDTVSKNSNSFKIIENMPIYKGCENEKDNINKKKCASQKIAELFKKHFNTKLPKDSNIPSGEVKIFLRFSVDIDGSIVDSIAEAPNKYLENEALRVLTLIPKFKPGYLRDEPIKVPFSLPLIVIVENGNYNDENFTYPIFRGCDKDLSNEELKKCSKEKITNFIKMSYDLDIAEAALPLDKSTQFQLNFIINKNGKVEQVNAKANHRAIAIEAIKVAKRLPKFKKPGTKNGKAVDIPFSLLMTIYFNEH